MIVHTGLTSPFPRSEALVRATRDLDRGRITPEAVEGLYRSSELDVVKLERRLGFSTVTAGDLRSADLFRPLAETWEGFEIGPITRWFETNTFFRQPILLHPPARTAGKFAARLPLPLRDDPSSGRVLLPGPFTFAGLLDNRSGETETALIHRLGRLLAAEVAELRGLGFGTFVFSEPLAVVRPPEGPRAESLLEAYRAIGSSTNGGTSIVWTFGADATPALPLLGRLPVSVVGLDLADTDVDELPRGSAHAELGLGVIDARTTLVEDPQDVTRVVRAALERRPSPAVWLGPGGPLALLPAEPAARKIETLAAARAALEAGGRS